MFEYKVLQSDTLISEKQLNELGQKGWKLVTIAPGFRGLKVSQWYFYFVRAVMQ